MEVGFAEGFAEGLVLGMVEEDNLHVGAQVDGSEEGDVEGPKEDGFPVGTIECRQDSECKLLYVYNLKNQCNTYTLVRHLTHTYTHIL